MGACGVMQIKVEKGHRLFCFEWKGLLHSKTFGATKWSFRLRSCPYANEVIPTPTKLSLRLRSRPFAFEVARDTYPPRRLFSLEVSPTKTSKHVDFRSRSSLRSRGPISFPPLHRRRRLRGLAHAPKIFNFKHRGQVVTEYENLR